MRSTIVSTLRRLKSKRWQRESMVAGSLCGSVVARMNTAWAGGSSSAVSYTHLDDEDEVPEDLPDKDQRAGHGEMTLEELINDHQICGLITRTDAWDEDGGSVPDSREQEAERDRED